MKTLILWLALAGIAAPAAERSISRDKLPEAVRKTVDEQSKGATIVGFAKETEGGKTYYEAEMRVNGRTKDVLMDPTGKVVNIEEEVPLDTVPAAVKAGFEKRAGKRKIVLVESITTDQGIVAFLENHPYVSRNLAQAFLCHDGSLFIPAEKSTGNAW